MNQVRSLEVAPSSYRIKALRYIGNVETQEHYLLRAPTTVMLVSAVSTRDCDSHSIGSNPIRHPIYAHSSVGIEYHATNVRVGGSSPSGRTSFAPVA